MLECQAMIEPQAQRAGLGMTFPRFDLPTFANADRTSVKQVLINLLSNAIKYNRKDGTVEVTCAAAGRGHVRISVKDSGAGLPPEKLAQLFQAFNRLGQGSSEEGTGIGLVVTKRLVEVMGGKIGVESVVGVGSTFWVDLIADSAPGLALNGAEPPTVPEPQAPGKAHVHTMLYVEDNRANLQLVVQIIARRPEIRLLSATTQPLGRGSFRRLRGGRDGVQNRAIA